jgi:hypothetical protein
MSIEQTIALRAAYVDMVVAHVRHWGGADADREHARVWLDGWRSRRGLDDELRDRVLAEFEPRRDPVDGKDFLADPDEWVTVHRSHIAHRHTADDEEECVDAACLTYVKPELSADALALAEAFVARVGRTGEREAS